MEIYRLHPLVVEIFLWTAGIIVTLAIIAFTVLSFLPSPAIQKFYQRFVERKNP